jgi:hypothetical protein
MQQVVQTLCRASNGAFAIGHERNACVVPAIPRESLLSSVWPERAFVTW